MAKSYKLLCDIDTAVYGLVETGTILKEFTGCTYGCIQDGIAVTKEDDGERFFEVDYKDVVPLVEEKQVGLFKKGDRVESRKSGQGTVTSIYGRGLFPIEVSFDNGFHTCFKENGQEWLQPNTLNDIHVVDEKKVKKEEKKMDNLTTILKDVPTEQILKLPYFQNRGKRFVQRAFIDDQTGRNEKAFSDVIKKYHEGFSGNEMRMNQILETDSEEALEACFTTFQWLATNVGSCHLEEALRACGKKIVNIEEELL